MFSPDLLPATRSAPPAYPLVSEPADLSQIFVRQPIEKLQPGEAVFCEADPATDLVQVTEGCLRRYRILPDGRRAITGFAFPGDVLGLASMDQYSYTAEAVTPVKLRRVSRRRFHALVDDSAQLRPQRRLGRVAASPGKQLARPRRNSGATIALSDAISLKHLGHQILSSGRYGVRHDAGTD